MRISRLILIVAALLVALPGVGLAATVTVAEDQVEWAASDGDDIGFIGTDATGVFFIRDDALETTATGTAVFSGMPASSTFSILPPGPRARAHRQLLRPVSSES